MSERSVYAGEMFRDEVAQIRQSIQVGNLSQAVEDAGMLIEIAPKNEDAWLLRGIALQKMSRFEDAARDFERALELDPGLAKAHYNLGMIYAFKLADARRAYDHFDAYVALEPNGQGASGAREIMRGLVAKIEQSVPKEQRIDFYFERAPYNQEIHP